MGLILPEVSVTLGPIWAQMLNTAANVTDNHDHSPGKGVKIKPSGLNINSDLTFGGNNATNMNSIEFLTTLTGTLTSISSIYSFGGDLWYNNGGGTPVQITSGSSVIAPIGGSLNEYEYTSIAANTTILPSDTFCYINVDTTSSVQITLPLASSVANGRFYIVKDFNGLSGTNNISIVPSGADLIDGLNTQIAIDSAYAEITLVNDGISAWSLVSKKNTPRATADNTLLRSDGTNGYIQGSGVVVDDSNNITGAASLTTSAAITAGGALTGASTNAATANVFWETVTRSTGTSVSARGIAISSESGNVVSTANSEEDFGVTATITTVGRPIWVGITCDASGGVLELNDLGATAGGTLRIKRDGTTIYSVHYDQNVASGLSSMGTACTCWTISNPGAGTYAFTATIQADSGVTSMSIDDLKIIAFEL